MKMAAGRYRAAGVMRIVRSVAMYGLRLGRSHGSPLQGRPNREKSMSEGYFLANQVRVAMYVNAMPASVGKAIISAASVTRGFRFEPR